MKYLIYCMSVYTFGPNERRANATLLSECVDSPVLSQFYSNVETRIYHTRQDFSY